MKDKKKLFPSTWHVSDKESVSWEFAVDGKLNEYMAGRYSHKIGSYIYIYEKRKLIVITIRGTSIYDVECCSESSIRLTNEDNIIELHRKS